MRSTSCCGEVSTNFSGSRTPTGRRESIATIPTLAHAAATTLGGFRSRAVAVEQDDGAVRVGTQRRGVRLTTQQGKRGGHGVVDACRRSTFTLPSTSNARPFAWIARLASASPPCAPRREASAAPCGPGRARRGSARRAGRPSASVSDGVQTAIVEKLTDRARLARVRRRLRRYVGDTPMGARLVVTGFIPRSGSPRMPFELRHRLPSIECPRSDRCRGAPARQGRAPCSRHTASPPTSAWGRPSCRA
jgi:hypothetical protein